MSTALKLEWVCVCRGRLPRAGGGGHNLGAARQCAGGAACICRPGRRGRACAWRRGVRGCSYGAGRDRRCCSRAAFRQPCGGVAAPANEERLHARRGPPRLRVNAAGLHQLAAAVGARTSGSGGDRGAAVQLARAAARHRHAGRHRSHASCADAGGAAARRTVGCTTCGRAAASMVRGWRAHRARRVLAQGKCE